MSTQASTAVVETQVTWLSGAVVTFLNKLAFPVLWFGGLVGLPVWVYTTTGRLSVKPDFQFMVWFILIATVWLGWITAHLQLVGYRSGELVVANYWREERIPFSFVEAVDPVWWNRGRLVRIRFNHPTSFGTVVYYLPKWGSIRAPFSSPEQELRRIVSTKL